MTANDISNARSLAFKLLTGYGSDVRATAFMIAQMYESGRPLDIWQGSDAPKKAQVAARICGIIADYDDPRYSHSDYVDAMTGSRRLIDYAKLLVLSDDDFMAAISWLAADKRESYEDRPHVQAPLGLDIYADGEAD